LDGDMIWRGTEPQPLDVDYRVLLSGNSVGSKMLIGPLTVWTGVRPGVNWFRAPR